MAMSTNNRQSDIPEPQAYVKIGTVKNAVLLYSHKDRDYTSLPCRVVTKDIEMLELGQIPIVGWMQSAITKERHICCYPMSSPESLQMIKQKCPFPQIAGFVLVNQSGRIDNPDFFDVDNNIPMCVVSSNVCQEMLHALHIDVDGGTSEPSTSVLVKICAIEGVLDLQCGSREEKVNFHSPGTLHLQTTKLTQCVTCLTAPLDKVKPILLISPVKNSDDIQTLKNDLRVSHSRIAGVIIIPVKQGVGVNDAKPWDLDDPPLYVSHSEDPENKMLQFLRIVPEPLPSQHFADTTKKIFSNFTLPPVSFLPVSGTITFTGSGSGGRSQEIKFRFESFKEDDLTLKFPPFARPIPCVDAKKPARLDAPFIAYHILQNTETRDDFYKSIHSSVRECASGILILHHTSGSALNIRHNLIDERLVKDDHLSFFVVGYHHTTEMSLTNASRNIILSLEEAKMAHGAKSAPVRVLNPQPVEVSTEQHHLLCYNESPPIGEKYMRLVPCSDNVCYSDIVTTVKEEIDSGHLAGFIVHSSFNDNVKYKDLRPPVGFFDINRDCGLPQIAVFAITYTNFKKIPGASRYVTEQNPTKGNNTGFLGWFASGVTKISSLFSSSVKLCPILKDFNWNQSTSVEAIVTLTTNVKAWNYVDDKQEAVDFLHHQLTQTGLNLLPVYIFMAWKMDKDEPMQRDYLRKLFKVFENKASSEIVASLKDCSKCLVGMKELDQFTQALQLIISKDSDQTVQALWITIYLYLCQCAKKDVKDEWHVLYNMKSQPFEVTESSCARLQKWIGLGYHLQIQYTLRFSHNTLANMLNISQFVSFPALRMIFRYFQTTLFSTAGHVHSFLKTVRSGKYIATNGFNATEIQEGTAFLHGDVMTVHCKEDHHADPLPNELKQWWRMLARACRLSAGQDTICALQALLETLQQSNCRSSPVMMDGVIVELNDKMKHIEFLRSVSLQHFWMLHESIGRVEKQVVLLFWKNCSTNIELTDSAFGPMVSSVIQKYPDKEISLAFSDFLIRSIRSYPGLRVKELLHLNVPQLFSPDIPDIQPVCQQFWSQLKHLFEEKKLRLKCQEIYLQYLQEENSQTVPIEQLILESMTPLLFMTEPDLKLSGEMRHTKSFKCFEVVTGKLVAAYTATSTCWSEIPTFPNSMYWEIIAAPASLPQPSANIVEWCQKLSILVKIASPLYRSAIFQNQLEAQIWKDFKPAKILLGWIQELSRRLTALHKDINENEWTKESIEDYKKCEPAVQDVAQFLSLDISITPPLELLDKFDKSCLQIAQTLLKRTDTDQWILLLNVIEKFKCRLDEKVKCHISDTLDETMLRKLNEVTVGLDADRQLLPMFRKRMKMSSLIAAEEAVTEAFHSLEEYMPGLVYFHSKKGRLFEKFLVTKLEDTKDYSLQGFATCVKGALEFLAKIISEKVEYKQLTHLHFFNLNDHQKHSEMELLRNFHGLESDDHARLSAFKDMTDLISIVEVVPLIREVCEMCQLECCLLDPDFKYLVEMHDTYDGEEARGTLNTEVATMAMTKIRGILPVDCRELDLLQEIRQNLDFFTFIRDIEQKGQTRFQDLRSLITSILQHEEYNDEVLNQLPIARGYVLPFLDQNKSFKQLIDSVKELHARTNGDFRQLELMKKNMNLIRSWFSKAESDSLESVVQDLDVVMSKGKFCIGTRLGLLCDSLSTYRTTSDVGGEETEKASSESVINEDWIDDFNGRLGLLEKKQDVKGDAEKERKAEEMLKSIEKFQIAFKSAKKMSLVWVEMTSLACPYANNVEPVPCCKSAEFFNGLLEEMNDQLKEWKRNLNELRTDFKELFLLSIPKVKRLFESLQAGDKEMLLKEVAHIAMSQGMNSTQLKERIEDVSSVPETKVLTTESGPFRTVGQFLQAVFRSNLLRDQTYSHQKVVHLLPEKHQRAALNVLYSVYARVPFPFEVYHCQRCTTDKDLLSIFERAKAYKMTICILNVNLLSLRMQEILLKLHKQSVSENFGVHYVASGVSIAQDLPNVQLQKFTSVDDSTVARQWDELCTVYKQKGLKDKVLEEVELVYGRPGDGKSHYIRNKLKSFSQTAIITFDEAFSIAEAINCLKKLSLHKKTAIYLNFTLLPVSEKSSDHDRMKYTKIITTIQWFLFDLFFLGYVEDAESGSSFSFVKGLNSAWTVYVEVPNRYVDESSTSLDEGVKLSFEAFLEEFPVMDLLGNAVHIKPDHPLDVIDDDTQVVCKYLKAFCRRSDRRIGIDKCFNGHAHEKVAFERMPKVSVRECRRLLKVMTPKNASVNKMHQTIFIKYMARRCRFLEKCPSYNYNAYEVDEKGNPKAYSVTKKTEGGKKVVISFDTSCLGSSLFEAMLKEVDDFCSPRRRSNWEGDPRQQLVYVLDGIQEDGKEGGSFEVVALRPDDMPKKDRELFQKILVSVQNRDDLETREVLDKYIASAFGLKLVDGRLIEIDKKNYVLTLDFALKMLEINERYWARVPVIIEGETGVGKTFLVEMMADLWNGGLMHRWSKIVTRLWSLMLRLSLVILGRFDEDISDDEKELFTASLHVIKLSCDRLNKKIPELVGAKMLDQIPTGDVTITEMKIVIQFAHNNRIAELQLLMNELEIIIERQPLIHLLKVSNRKDLGNTPGSTSVPLDSEIRHNTDPTVATVNLYRLLIECQVDVFHRMSVHGSLSAEDIIEFFKPIIAQAEKVENKWKDMSTCPSITVFLDEINTSSCPGLIKEILVDKSLHGERIPRSIFVIGACNPHRGNSVAIHASTVSIPETDKTSEASNQLEVESMVRKPTQIKDSTSWVKGSYYVHEMHQSVHNLRWDYGALDDRQEKLYIDAKMAMVMGNDEDFDKDLREVLSDKVAESQQLMRKYACEHYVNLGSELKLAEATSRSCVSQRDIQRVFTFYVWLLRTYEKFKAKSVKEHPAADEDREQWQQRAVMVALGLTYYFRLSAEFREKYEETMDFSIGGGDAVTFSEALCEEMDFYTNIVHLSPGIAKTRALKENLFCVIACCCTQMPLIIVGEPGSSKTLSFNIAASNFKGADSKSELLKDTSLFPCFDPHYYQCSRTTTSKEVEVVFQRALRRQEVVSMQQYYDKFQNIVFMDEAGLPEESLESLKVIHKYLDAPKVSFVAITNHMLDAAKTNRAVTLFRPSDEQDVRELAYGCLGVAKEGLIEVAVEHLCSCYDQLMKKDQSFKHFFGLRDFIYFMNYLRRNTENIIRLEDEGFRQNMTNRAVERNFNGHIQMETVHEIFCPEISANSSLYAVIWRNIIDVLSESLEDRPKPVESEDQEDFEEVRYKLIIDPTEDDSSRRMMMMFHVLHPDSTTTVIGSDFSDDGYLQNINAVSKIIQAARIGATVLMMQTDEIHESFYDLFNQHFRKIKVVSQTEEKQTHFYATVAIGSHSKPCRINQNFQCVVIIKDSELESTPAPFLNRFEKFRLSTTCFLEASINTLPLILRRTVEAVKDTVWMAKGVRPTRNTPFVNDLGEASFVGLVGEDTVNSLFLSIVPKGGYVKVPLEPLSDEWLREDIGELVLPILRMVLTTLSASGFNISMSRGDIQQDAEVLQNILQKDTRTFASAFDTNHQVYVCLNEAWDLLTGDDDLGGALTPALDYLIIFLKTWIHIWVTRKLLQLLTEEAFILHKKKFQKKYSWCLKAYLNRQQQFDLIRAIRGDAGFNSEPSTVMSKTVCLTRSFQVFLNFASIADDTESQESHCQLCSLSGVSSQQEFNDELQTFVASHEKNVLIIMANMFEASKKLINYIRLRIDEMEEQRQVCGPKKFVLLLYFPASVTQVYPALFLYGWDFHYLDSLNIENGVQFSSQVNQWCAFAYLESSNGMQLLQRSDSRSQGDKYKGLLKSCSAPLCARVTVWEDGQPVANKEKKQLFDAVLNSDVGTKLLSMYLNYWAMSQTKVARILHGIAAFSNQLKSLHSVTDLFQVYFESTFHNFMAFMLHHINEELDITSFHENTQELFLEVVDIVELPKSLSIIRSCNNTWGIKKVSTCSKRNYFPGFNKMFRRFEDELKPYFDQSGGKPNSVDIAVQMKAECQGNAIIAAVIRCIEENDKLCHLYEEDMCRKLRLTDQDRTVINHYLSPRDAATKGNVAKLIDLHFIAYAKPIDFSTFRRLLGPIMSLQPGSEQQVSMDSLIVSLLSGLADGSTGTDGLGEIIVTNLETTLLASCGQFKPMKEWQDAFKRICNEKQLKDALYATKRSADPWYRSRFLCVKAVSILMESQPEPDEEYCTSVWAFYDCLQQHQSQDGGGLVNLDCVLKIVLNKQKTESERFIPPASCVLKYFLPELLCHVFNSSFQQFDEADVITFLEFVGELPFAETHGQDVTVPLAALNQTMGAVLTSGLMVAKKDKDSYGLIKKRKSCVVDVLTMKSPALAKSYSPPFYADAEDQTLAHLYFFTLLGIIKKRSASRENTSSECVRAINRGSKCTDALAVIEKQIYIYLLLVQVSSDLSDSSKELTVKHDKVFSDCLCKVGRIRDHFQVFRLMIEQKVDNPDKKQRLIEKVASLLTMEEIDVPVEVNVARHLVPHFWGKQDVVGHLDKAPPLTTHLASFLKYVLDNHKKIQASMKLLPIIAEFCMSVKKLLDFRIVAADTQMSIMQAVYTACKDLSRSGSDALKKFESLLKDFQKCYADFKGQTHRVIDINENTPVSDILEVTVPKCKETGTFKALKIEIAAHNTLIQKAFGCVSHYPNMAQWYHKPGYIQVYEIENLKKLFPECPDENRLIECMRKCLPVVGDDLTAECMERMYTTVIKDFFLGTPLIEDPSPDVIQDIFMVSLKSSAKQADLVFNNELAAIRDQLQSCLKNAKESFPEKDIMAHFHNADYSLLVGLVNGLIQVARHLTQQQSPETYSRKTVRQFLEDRLAETLSDTMNLSRSTDLRVLEKLQMGSIERVLTMFVNWIETGFCNFHSLPLGAKKDPDMILDPQFGDVYSFLKAKAQEYSHRENICRLEDVLMPDSMGLTMGDSFEMHVFETPLRKYVVDVRLLKATSPLLDLIPEGIQLQHYVHFMLALRKINADNRSDFVSDSATDVEDSDEEETDPQSQMLEIIKRIKEPVTSINNTPRLTSEENTISEDSSSSSDEDNTSSVDRTSKSSDDSDEYESCHEADTPSQIEGGDSVLFRKVSKPETQSRQIESSEVTVEDLEPPAAERSSIPLGKTEPGPDKQDDPRVEKPLQSDSQVPTADAEGVSPKAKAMTVADMLKWLDDIGLSQYKESFQEEDVTGALFAELTIADLENDLGVAKSIHRKKLMLKFKEIK